MTTMSATRSGSQRICNFRYYTPAWEIGTGLQVSLAPGKYHVTKEEVRGGVRYFCLDETYRIAACDYGN
jgi:hypothetical protein